MKIQSHIILWLMHFLLMVLGLISIAHAEPIVLNGDNPTPVLLAPSYQLHIDSEQKLNINDFLSPSNQIEFSPFTNSDYQRELGSTKESLWFKVDVSNANAYDIKQLLEFNFPLLNDLGIYIVHKTSKRILARFDADNSQSFNSRLYQHSNFIFPITLPAQSDLTFYFRIQSNRHIAVGATLWQPNAFAEQDRLSYFLMCLYLGLLISAACFSILLFISIRDTYYIYYALFSTALLLAVGSYKGIWFELIWSSMPSWQAISFPISFGISGIFAVLFSSSFLQTKIETPILNKAFIALIVIFAAAIITTPFIAVTTSMQILAATAMVLTVIAMTAAITLSINKSRMGQVYLISWLVFWIGVALFSAQTLGWLTQNIWTHNSIIYGSVLEIFLMLCALAYSITLINKENNLSRQEIFKTQNKLLDTLRTNEQEFYSAVKKRTSTLEMANKYLESQKDNHHDTLTGLANASLMTEQLQLLLTQCKRKEITLAVLIVNVNAFKDVNDKFGHEVGDKLLISIAAKLRDNLRESDVAARTHGDEFILLLEITNADKDAEHVAKKLKKSLTETILIDGYAIQINVGIGIALYPDNGDDAEGLLAKATQAMYVDKGYLKTAEDLISN